MKSSIWSCWNITYAGSSRSHWSQFFPSWLCLRPIPPSPPPASSLSTTTLIPYPYPFLICDPTPPVPNPTHYAAFNLHKSSRRCINILMMLINSATVHTTLMQQLQNRPHHTFLLHPWAYFTFSFIYGSVDFRFTKQWYVFDLVKKLSQTVVQTSSVTNWNGVSDRNYVYIAISRSRPFRPSSVHSPDPGLYFKIRFVFVFIIYCNMWTKIFDCFAWYDENIF